MHRSAHTLSTQARTERRDALRLEVLEAYGGARCSCCGEPEPIFLTLDHSRDDGWKGRDLIGGRRSGMLLYQKLKALGFPQDLGIRVQCFNCNCGRARNGGVCPHARLRASKGRHGQVMLTQADIDFIKGEYASRGRKPDGDLRLTIAQLGKRYGLSVPTIMKIQHGVRTR